MSQLSGYINLRSILFFCLFIFSCPVFSFGVLMTTPQERVELDKHRNGSKRLPMANTTNRHMPVLQVLTLDGLVKRHDGPNTIWVNGAIKQKPSVSGVFIDADRLVDSAVFLKRSPESSPLFIKPGQRLDIDKGDVTESYIANTQLRTRPIDKVSDTALDVPLSDAMRDRE